MTSGILAKERLRHHHGMVLQHWIDKDDMHPVHHSLDTSTVFIYLVYIIINKSSSVQHVLQTNKMNTNTTYL